MPRPRKQPLPSLEKASDDIGRRLAKIRKSRGLTQVQLAERVGINQYLVSDYETGRLHLSDEMIIRLATALDTSADAILGLSGSAIDTPSLKIVKRVKALEQLPDIKQKAILKTLDDLIRANQ